MSSVLGEMVANTLGRPHAPKRCKHAACDGGREGRCVGAAGALMRLARESARGSAARERAVDELGRLALWGEDRAGMLAVGVADVLMRVVAEEAVGSLTRERAVEAIG